MRSPTILLYSILLCVTYFGTAVFQQLNSGRECKNDGDCVMNAYCFEGKMCLCRNGFVAINTSKKTFICVNEASNVGDVCQYDIQCGKALGIHSECKKNIGEADKAGRCQCKQDSHYQDGICYPNSRIGEACQVNDNCVILTPNLAAYCDHSRCVCPPYYHPDDYGTDCLPSSDLGGPCITDDDCITMNSRCRNVCECNMGYIVNEKRTDCLKAADKLHDPCDEDKQCSEFLPRSTCDPIRKRCNCSLGLHEVNGACFQSARLHEPCTQKEECLIDSRDLSRIECNGGFCICAEHYEMVNRSDCIDPRRTFPGTPTGVGVMRQINTSLMMVITAIAALW
uniref:Putative platelet endothelial aggregation receptor 1 n=1 Tax=Triatoma infestans TaxID=30076 RepID=A0A023F6R2_TRIIF